ncbi:uncharacterized protein Ecym_2386 [Eremothecium cymbalariae DBVPG|uniref:Vacuolar membrane protein n=1 Tax=Eremothecium cymbalariae (strain CBS 270.75 / DBVPG 7215 / KCTC 17166 / NRRL Y-17582) TaxID=931890 RepID=G8JNQ1_ERECY|nr:Hypothetical protein Ecym_2386 [Eremothecium cymbalariae DBVPG\
MDEDQESCQLLGFVSILIQFCMGTAAIGGLLIKRHYEHPKRTWIVWSYDLGKQMFGSLGVHFLNVILSILKAKGLLFNIAVDYRGHGEDKGEQCDWYFINLLMDTTVGIPILWCWLRLIYKTMKYFNVTNIESGNYYPVLEKPDIYSSQHSSSKQGPMFTAFLKQLLIFISGLALMKGCIYLILSYFETFADFFANLVLGWSDRWPNFQVFLVMFVFPVALNCFQYFCIDNIIKLPSDHLNKQNINSFDQESIIEENGIYVSTYNQIIKASYGTV